MNEIEHRMDNLRKKALKILEEKGVQDQSLFRAGMEELIQEVSIYQIELEHQNDELKKAWAELEGSRDRLSDLYHNAPAGYATIREDYIIEEINQTACTMLGFDHCRSLIGTRFTRFVHPKDQDGFYFHLTESLGKETPVQCEIDLAPAEDGTLVTVRMESIREPGDGGENRRIRSSIIDITRARQAERSALESEKRFVETVDLLPDAVFETDRKLGVTYANKAMTELLGFSGSRIHEGLNCLDLFSPDMRKEAEETIDRICSGSGLPASEFEFVTEGGDKIDGLFSAAPIETDGAFTGLRAGITDITELKRLQKEAVRARNLESLGTLAGNLAHEFNNLFMVIFGNLSFAKLELEEDHPAAQPLDAAGAAIENARELTGRLMTFSMGGAPVIRLVEPVATVKEALSKVPGCDGLSFEVHTEGTIRHVYADPDQLARAVSNIAANARDAMEGSGTLWVWFENVSDRDSQGDLPPSGEYVKIVFEDNGPGIPPGHKDKVFDPFFTTNEGSLGLGLTTAHSIISRHQGIMDTTRDLRRGTGAGFVVYLPAYSRQAEASAGESGPDDAGGQKDRTLKILVMDDDEAVRGISRKMLEKRGCEVTTAADGEEAIDLCRSAKDAESGFDAVILDLIVSEGMGGKEAVRHITAVDPETFVILASGYSSDPVMSNFQAYGFHAALEKPYRMADMERVLTKITSAGQNRPS
mgnify:CR=1 FL=1